MKLLYKGKKWDKEVLDTVKFYKNTKYDVFGKVMQYIDKFMADENKDYLKLYFSLGGGYHLLNLDLYLLDSDDRSIVKYMYFSGMCKTITDFLYDKGIRSDEYKNATIKNAKKEDMYTMCFQLLAVDKTLSKGIEEACNNMNNKVDKLIAELSDIDELKEAVSSVTELIEFGEYKLAVENLIENIIEDNYIISHRHYRMLEDILSVYNDEYDKQLLRSIIHS